MKRIVLSVLLIGVVVSTSVGAYLAISESGRQASASIPPATSIVSQNHTAPGMLALDTAVNASGLKSEVKGALRSNAESISERLNISVSQVNAAIDKLAIDSWEAASLPKDAIVSNSCVVNQEGVDINITTYVDSSYVTVSKNGQDITFAIPENAQNSLALFSVLA